MAFVEKQQKAGKTYYYLTTTVRRASKFKKERILLSIGKAPTKKHIEMAQQTFSASVPKKNMGHFIWERPCMLHYVYIAAQVCVNPQKEVYGYHWSDTYGFFSEGMVKFVWDMQHMTTAGIHIINNFLDDKYSKKKKQEWEKKTMQLKKTCRPSLERYTPAQLIRKYKEFTNALKQWWAASQVSDNIAYGAEYLLKDIVHEKDIGIITTPSEVSYTTQEELDLLSIALIKNKQEQQHRIKKHQEQYYWIKNNYSYITFLDKCYFEQQIQDIQKKGIDVQAHIQKILQRQKELMKKKEKTLGQYNLIDKEKKLMNIIEYFSIFQDKRKAISLEANHTTDMYLGQLAKRTGIAKKLLVHSTPYEYESILEGTFDMEILRARTLGCALIITEKSTDIVTGSAYKKVRKKIIGSEKKERITEFEGRRAEGGKVIGSVKIILDPRQAGTFQEGDILVTTMTSPEFLPLMKKAKAIITDEGGITSHAAVVARELGIPCIVGTKKATQILRDGQQIVVNANHGLIKIIE